MTKFLNYIQDLKIRLKSTFLSNLLKKKSAAIKASQHRKK